MRATTNRKSAVFLVTCLIAVLARIGVPDAAAAEVSKGAGVAVPLATFMPSTQPIRLRYTADEYTVYIPVSPRSKVKSALLHLQLTNSISLVKERSQVAVRLNGRVLAQVALNPVQPESSIDVLLARQLWHGVDPANDLPRADALC